MRVYAFTAGAANMYCGSCLRDNALAAEMKAQGHDIVLMPLYTPTLTDEPNVSESNVLFGGISVYLQNQSALFRKTPWFIDKLWDSTQALRAASKRSIAVNPKFLGEMTVAMLQGEDGPYRKEFQKMVHHLRQMDRPDIVTLPNSLVIAMAKPIRETLNCPVAVTLQGEDLFLEGLQDPYRTQALDLLRKQVPNVDAFIAVSQFGARIMGAYLGIDSARIHTIPLGINPSHFPKREDRNDGIFKIGYMARIAPEKSLHQLAEAYRWLRHDGGLPPSRLEAAGYLAPEHREYLSIIEKQLKEWDLHHEFHYHGTVDREQKINFLRSVDVLGVPSLYAEVKGLYVLEALACGLPIVAPNHGSFPEMLNTTGGGLLAQPDNPRDLGEKILSLHADRKLRNQLSEKGHCGVRKHYTVTAMAQKATEIYSALSN